MTTGENGMMFIFVPVGGPCTVYLLYQCRVRLAKSAIKDNIKDQCHDNKCDNGTTVHLIDFVF